MTPDETRRARLQQVAIEHCREEGCLDEQASEASETCADHYGADVDDYCWPCVMSGLLAELSRLSEAQQQLDAIDKAVPRRRESPDVPLVERVVQAVVQMQYDDERCRTWESEAATARAEVARLSEAQHHRCSGCDLRWKGELTGVELCGDCWRQTQRMRHLKEAAEAGEAEEINRRLAEVTRLTEAQEALRWLMHLHHGVGKAGGPPASGEWEAALEAGNAALARLTAAPEEAQNNERNVRGGVLDRGRTVAAPSEPAEVSDCSDSIGARGQAVVTAVIAEMRGSLGPSWPPNFQSGETVHRWMKELDALLTAAPEARSDK